MARIKLQTPNFNMAARADGIYEIRYTADGKLKSKSTGTRDAQAAETFRARFVQDFNSPKMAEKPTVENIVDGYLAVTLPRVKAPDTVKHSAAPISRLMGFTLADAVTQTAVNHYIERRGKETSRNSKKPISDSTINKELRTLRAALRWAASEHLISRTPAFKIGVTPGETRTNWLSKEEANLLINASAPHFALFMLIALGTAKRREAILSLKWADVSLEKPGHEFIHFGADVGNKRRGSTPVAGNKRLIDALKAAKAATNSEYVITYKGDRVRDVKTAIAAACRRAGVKSIGVHTFKHTAITWMVQDDMTYERISKFTNTSKDVIEAVYGHHSPSFVAEASRAVSF